MARYEGLGARSFGKKRDLLAATPATVSSPTPSATSSARAFSPVATENALRYISPHNHKLPQTAHSNPHRLTRTGRYLASETRLSESLRLVRAVGRSLSRRHRKFLSQRTRRVPGKSRELLDARPNNGRALNINLSTAHFRRIPSFLPLATCTSGDRTKSGTLTPDERKKEKQTRLFSFTVDARTSARTSARYRCAGSTNRLTEGKAPSPAR